MERKFYIDLVERSLQGELLEDGLCGRILSDTSLELLPLLDAAYQVRKTYHGKKVHVHILNNAQNGHCQEDCHYCAQAKSSTADIEEYGIKPDAEILAEARQAYAKGADCYCMVYAGRGASQSRIDRLTRVIGQIKKEFPGREICVSTGFVTPQGAGQLKRAGLDRLNHNLNTSESNYPNICTTHTYADRLNTLLAAREAGLKVCSGMIVGMGERDKDIIDVAKQLRKLEAESIPVNLLVPIDGAQLKVIEELSPEYCLRVLCLFRFLNPKAEIRVAAGREVRLRSLEVMALYPANSLFMQGYLNAKGADNAKTIAMIKDAGFEMLCDEPMVFSQEVKTKLKNIQELRPAL